MWLIIGEPMDHWSCGEWLMEDMADYEEVVAHGRYGGLRRGGCSLKICSLFWRHGGSLETHDSLLEILWFTGTNGYNSDT